MFWQTSDSTTEIGANFDISGGCSYGPTGNATLDHNAGITVTSTGSVTVSTTSAHLISPTNAYSIIVNSGGQWTDTNSIHQTPIFDQFMLNSGFYELGAADTESWNGKSSNGYSFENSGTAQFDAGTPTQPVLATNWGYAQQAGKTLIEGSGSVLINGVVTASQKVFDLKGGSLYVGDTGSAPTEPTLNIGGGDGTSFNWKTTSATVYMQIDLSKPGGGTYSAIDPDNANIQNTPPMDVTFNNTGGYANTYDFIVCANAITGGAVKNAPGSPHNAPGTTTWDFQLVNNGKTVQFYKTGGMSPLLIATVPGSGATPVAGQAGAAASGKMIAEHPAQTRAPWHQPLLPSEAALLALGQAHKKQDAWEELFAALPS